MEHWRALVGSVFALVIAVLRGVLALNFRGATDWFVRQGTEPTEWQRRRPPWLWLSEGQDARHARLLTLYRGVGTVFCALGVAVLIATVTTAFSGGQS